MFSRSPQALGSDRQIKKIMESTFDLEEYVGTLARSEDDILDLLKGEMVWDLVANEHTRMKGLQPKEDEEELDLPTTDPDDDLSAEDMDEPESKTEGDLSDEDLLAELEGI